MKIVAYKQYTYFVFQRDLILIVVFLGLLSHQPIDCQRLTGNTVSILDPMGRRIIFIVPLYCLFACNKSVSVAIKVILFLGIPRCRIIWSI